MLKWTASAQKLATQMTPTPMPMPMPMPMPTPTPVLRTPSLMSAHQRAEVKRRRRRATIANKENIPAYTSTPMAPRQRNSPIVLAPFADILNITPDPGTPLAASRTITAVAAVRNSLAAPTSMERRGKSTLAMQGGEVSKCLRTQARSSRRHSTIGLGLPSDIVLPQYASTLPHFEEEYSPSTAMPLPTGQQLAMRGLLPDPFRDPFLGQPRYLQSTESIKQKQCAEQRQQRESAKSVAKVEVLSKRKLEQEFAEIASESSDAAPTASLKCMDVTSTKMGDHTLDKLIDAILDSARKEEKKKKSRRKSFNLRRRTLLKSHTDSGPEPMLSPSYAAGDDPASDLSFMLCSALPPTPQPATPLPQMPFTDSMLTSLPTPSPNDVTVVSRSLACRNDSTNTFRLETPVRATAAKRRQDQLSMAEASEVPQVGSATKKFKVDERNYFEVGVALPSIYV